MKRYTFRLKTLEKLRAATRDQRRADLAEAFRVAERLAIEQTSLVAEEVRLRELQRSAAGGKYLDVNVLLEAQRYELVLKARGQELAKKAALVAAEIEHRRQMLVDADREVRVLELLDERQRREHMRLASRLELKQLDEIAVTRWQAR